MRSARVAFDPPVRVALDILVCILIVRIDLDPLVAFALRARVSIWAPFG